MLRIGELSRRVGVSDHVLRAWESRYGLLSPVRSPGGFRLYSPADERRVRRMQELLSGGLSAAEAARTVLAEQPPEPQAPPATEPAGSSGLSSLAQDLRRALDVLDEPRAQAVLDRLLSDYTVESVLRDVVMPYLHDLGDRWERGEVSVAYEHFASNVLRGRLASMTRGWGLARGPHAVLACAPGELHELGLMVFGIALSRLGWRVTYLGPSTPFDDLVDATTIQRPDMVVLAATDRRILDGMRAQLRELGGSVRLLLAGAGVTPELADDVGAVVVAGDPVTAAAALAAAEPAPAV
jgi:methanogenic corrinoid protein MtbC1